MNFLWEKKTKTKEDKRMVKLDFFFKISLFGHVFKKSSHSFCGAWSFLLVHIRFTPSEEPKGFANLFKIKKKLDHGIWTMEKGYLPWSDFMVHGASHNNSSLEPTLTRLYPLL